MQTVSYLLLVCLVLLHFPLHASAQKSSFGQNCTIDASVEGGKAVQEKSPLVIQDVSNPSLSYSVSGTAGAQPFSMLVFHDPGSNNCNTSELIAKGHRVDNARGGQFGYHFYISQSGQIFQAAPLNKRTNHVSMENTRGTVPHFSNTYAVGVTLICGHRQIPQAQLEAAVKLGHALQLAYKIPSNRIYGHGELQTNKNPNEGIVAARATRMSSAGTETQMKYALPDGRPVVCSVQGTPPRPCSGTSCEIFPNTQQNVTSMNSQQPIPVGQNGGYSLPANGGQSGAQSGDIQEWGYGHVQNPATVGSQIENQQTPGVTPPGTEEDKQKQVEDIEETNMASS